MAKVSKDDSSKDKNAVKAQVLKDLVSKVGSSSKIKAVKLKIKFK